MKNKIAIRFSIIGVILILLTAILVSVNYYNTFKNQIKHELMNYAKVFELNSDFMSGKIDDTIQFEDDIRVTMIDKDGNVLYDNAADASSMENHFSRPEVIDAMANGSGFTERNSETLGRKSVYYAEKMENGNILRISIEIKGVMTIFTESLPGIFLVLFLTFIVFVISAVGISGQIVAPIERLAERMDTPTDGKVYEEILPFIEKIHEQNIMRSEFTSNVSHELKTPLTSIVGYAQLIETGMAKEDDIVGFATKIDTESNRLLALINDIMKLSKLDENAGDVIKEKVDLLAVAKICRKRLQFKADERNIAFSVVGESTIINGVSTMLEELIYNLCDNSIRYNRENGVLIVSIYKTGQGTVLSVKDNGIGIARENQEHIFERFYRVDKSRSKASGGTGLGLSIVKHIAIYHNAGIEIESEEGSGTEIKVIFRTLS